MNSIFLSNANLDAFSPLKTSSFNSHSNLPNEILNKITGDKLKVLPSNSDNINSIKLEFTLPPQAAGAPLHYHLNFAETFEVVSGRLEMKIGSGKNVQILEKGDFAEIKPGLLHSFSNPHQIPVTFVTEALPAAEFEKFIRSMFGLANDGKTNAAGMPVNLLHLALALDYADLYFPVIPAWMQKVTRKTLRRLAEITGAEHELKKYFQTNF